MDSRLRNLLRQANVSGDIEAEASYLNRLLTIGELTEKQIELASYLGNEAATAIKEYDVPQRVASYSGGQMKIPTENWFCDPLFNGDPHDAAHLWADNLLYEAPPEIAIAATLLTFRYLILVDTNLNQARNLLNYYKLLADGIVSYSAKIKSKLNAMEEEVFARHDHCLGNNLPFFQHEQRMLWFVPAGFVRVIDTYQNGTRDFMEFHSLLQPLLGILLEIINKSSDQEATLMDFCHFMTRNLTPYILGYRDLSETLFEITI